MFNNITSALLSGDSSEKLIWTLCSVLCGSCLHLNNCVTDQLSIATWAQVAGQVSCNIQSIYLILMYRPVVGLQPSLRSWWFVWREGKTLRKHAHYENARKACVFRPILLAALSVICALYKQNRQLHRLQF